MALAVVASFTDLQEAHIAAGALCAAGLRAEVFDNQLGTVDWMIQRALGGFRLAVPDQEAQTARELLAEFAREAPAPEPVDDRLGVRQVAGFATLPIPELAYLSARRRGFGAESWAGMGLALVLFLGAFAGASVVLYLLGNLLFNPP
jgi:hypothetical protein